MNEKNKFGKYESLMEYIVHEQNDILSGKSQYKLEKSLTIMYALYKAAAGIGEVTWDQAFYMYADFTAKLLGIR